MSAHTERLLKAYNKTKETSRVPSNDVWSNIQNNYQKEYLHLLDRNSPDELEIFLNSDQNGANWGIYNKDNDSQEAINQRLYMLASGLGILSYENPEQPGPTDTLESFKDRIDTVLGVKPTYTVKDLEGIYNAWMLKRFCDPRRILEIGAGAARTAYWNVIFGAEDYTIIDLPHTNVIQADYLITMLGDKSVWLYGEGGPLRTVKILPVFAFQHFEDKYFDVVLNQDSMPEINGDIVKQYLKQIKKCCKGYFVSINQESRSMSLGFKQHFLPDVIKEVGGFDLMLRMPYWMRKGYVLEVYRI